ncbi:MAG: hypothetical protein AAFP69_23765 [Planctomycetota bacterium]
MNSPQSSAFNRRSFLAAAGLVASGTVVSSAFADADTGKAYLLRPGGGRLYRVRVEMDTKGNVHLAKNPMASKEIAIRVPLKAESVLDYEERLLAIDKTADATSASQRYYHDAQSTSTLNGKETTSRLRKIARTTIVRQGSRTEQTGAGEMAGSRAMEYSVQDYFRQDELDLLYVPVCSLAVDSVLPESPIAKGQVVKVNEDAIARMVNVASMRRPESSLMCA